MRVIKALDEAMLKHSSSKRGNESAKMFASERASLSSTPHLKEQRSCSRCAAQNKSKRGNERMKTASLSCSELDRAVHEASEVTNMASDA